MGSEFAHESAFEDLNSQLTIIIRSIGERTDALCYALVCEQIAPENVHVVGEVPFAKTLETTFQVGLKANRKWTLCLDADVLVRPGFVKEIFLYAETCCEDVFEINAVSIDKFLVSPREVGQRLYRTSCFHQALKHIEACQSQLRPETFIVDQIVQSGLVQDHVPILVGLHDFHQSYRDIFRKIFVHARKHKGAGIAADYKLWHKYAAYDDDYKLAIAAYKHSLKHDGSVFIDREAAFMSDFENLLEGLGLSEKAALTCANGSYVEFNSLLFEHLGMYKQIQKNTPSFYRMYVSDNFFKNFRRWLIQVKIKKNFKLVTLFGVQVYKKVT